MSSAVILGGTGVVGTAIADRLARRGWSVVVTGRDPRRLSGELDALGVRFAACDRRDLAGVRTLLGSRGHDLLVDCLCFTASDARSLLGLADGIGSTVMISTKAVYADDAGRSVNSPTPPHFPVPITEDVGVVAPGVGDPMIGEGYGSHKVAAEQTVLESDLPVTVIRPSKIHGPGGSQPREWFFVKRCLDRRPAVLLADRGRSVDHTTSAANLAALVEVVARRPGRRILNSADPDAPSVLDISRTIAGHLGHRFDEYLLDPDSDPTLGVHPWMAAAPIVLDTSAAAALGYVPVGNYADTVGESIRWMTRRARLEPGEGATLPDSDRDWFQGMFDYAGEDRYISNSERSS